MRYLKGTLNLGLMYKRNNEGELVRFSDAGWTCNSNDRKSTSGYVFFSQWVFCQLEEQETVVCGVMQLLKQNVAS